MNKDTLEKLKEMKLYGMYNTFKASLENYGRNNMTIDKFVNMLVCNEWDERYNRHVNHLIKTAGFRLSATQGRPSSPRPSATAPVRRTSGLSMPIRPV